MDKNLFAKTPPMGWNSYDYYDTAVNEKQVHQNADYMAKHLKSFGWEYIIVDIEWYAHKAGSMRDKYQYIPFSELEMDAYSRLFPDPERFPSSVDGAGFKPLADYIHGLGLKFGIHIMRGIPRIAAHQHCAIKNCEVTANVVADPSSICGWNPDMYGVRNTAEGQAYYDSLLELYASWGVDFIKCDDICNTNLYRENQYSARHEVEMLAKAIQKCGRAIVLSLSPGPALIEQAWHYEKYANMWRITDDFWDNWSSLKDMFHRCELWQKHVSQGCYPDCDMLPLGYLGKGFGEERQTFFTKDEQKTMMTLWCIFGAPLMLGAEMTKLDEWTQSLLTNEKILKLLTPDCVPVQICLDDKKAVWMARNKEEKASYLAMFNLDETACRIKVDLKELLLDENPQVLLDLWTNEEIKIAESNFENKEFVSQAEIPAHGCVVYQLL